MKTTFEIAKQVAEDKWLPWDRISPEGQILVRAIATWMPNAWDCAVDCEVLKAYINAFATAMHAELQSIPIRCNRCDSPVTNERECGTCGQFCPGEPHKYPPGSIGEALGLREGDEDA